MIHHGGNLLSVAKEYGSNPKDWLDLSTGVSPFSYPVPTLPQDCWHHLPQDDDGLEIAAAHYYLKSERTTSLLPVSGSQAAIMTLPRLLLENLDTTTGRVVLLPKVGYKEHEKAWTNACDSVGVPYEYYHKEPSAEQRARALILLVINVNNPLGHCIPKHTLKAWHQDLKATGGYLVVDEAFIDLIEGNSLLPKREDFANLVVLRSIGKFFGLAGLRVGFVFLESRLKQDLQHQLGPWTLSGASRYIARYALQDDAWQDEQRICIDKISRLQMQVLTEYFDENSVVQAPLFFRVEMPNAARLYDQLCRQQILVRLCDEQDAVRFGLVADKKQLLRLKEALEDAG